MKYYYVWKKIKKCFLFPFSSYLEHKTTELVFVLLLGIVLCNRDENLEWILNKKKKVYNRSSHA